MTKKLQDCKTVPMELFICCQGVKLFFNIKKTFLFIKVLPKIEFCQILSFVKYWVLSKIEFCIKLRFCHNSSFLVVTICRSDRKCCWVTICCCWVFFSFVTFWVFELSHIKLLSFVILWVWVVSHFRAIMVFTLKNILVLPGGCNMRILRGLKYIMFLPRGWK